MEDHFVLFPILILIGVMYAAWYAIKLIYFTLGAIGLLVYKFFKKKPNNETEVDNNNVNR